MKRIVQIAFAVYCIVGIGSLMLMTRFAYYDAAGRDRFIARHALILILFAILAGLGGFFMVKTAFVEKYQQRVAQRPWVKIVAPVLLTIVCFIVNLGFLFGYDSMAADTGTYRLRGFVTNKIVTHGKGNGYFVWVRDDFKATVYKFEVTRAVYDKTPLTSEFDKQFNIDKLGILYRKEE
ncbi:MAG TPA: hypothetical protein VGM41_16055 [Chitinophagaceae bacterium]|jgi:H+/Cl- antiporter ClcA